MKKEEVFGWAESELRLQIAADLEWAKELRSRLGDLRYALGWSEYEVEIKKLLSEIKRMRRDLYAYKTAGEEAYIDSYLVVSEGSKAEWIRVKMFYKALGVLFNFPYSEFKKGSMFVIEKSMYGDYYDIIRVLHVPSGKWRLETTELIYRVYDFPVTD